MPKSSPQAWVKNVYNPLFTATKSWKKSVELFTRLSGQAFKAPDGVGNHVLFPTVTRLLSTQFYTPQFAQITLVNREFYPLSTRPTITTTKGKRR